MGKKGFRQLIAFAIVAVCTSAAIAEIHIVKKGETLSKIYFSKFGKPLFSQKNWRHSIQALNPHITNPNLIFPGQEVRLEAEVVSPRSVAAEAVAAAEAQATPPPVVAAPVPQEADPSESYPKSRLGIELGYEHFRIDSQDRSTGASSMFLSDLSPQAKIGWTLQWGKDWSSLVQLSLLSQKILKDERSPSITLQNNQTTRYGFLVGAQRHWNDSNQTAFLLNYQERVFAHSPSASVIVMDRVASPSFRFSHDSDIFKLRTARFGLNLALEYIFSGSGPGYATKAGNSGDVGVYLKHETKNAVLSGSVYFGMTKQDSDLVVQSEKHLGALMGLAWTFE